MKAKFYVIKKSAGYVSKTFNDLEVAKEYARKCNKANNCKDFIVCQSNFGIMIEI